MLIEHDTGADAVYVRLAEGDVARTVEIDEMLLVDEDAAGRPVGIEILTHDLSSVVWQRLFDRYPGLKEHSAALVEA